MWPIRCFEHHYYDEVIGVLILLELGYNIPSFTNFNAPRPNELAKFLEGRQTKWIWHSFSKSNLVKRNRASWLVVSNAIELTTHNNFIYLQKAITMEAITRNRPVCLVRLVVSKIPRINESIAHNEFIKFGVLITKLCLRAGAIDRDGDERKMQRSLVNRST